MIREAIIKEIERRGETVYEYTKRQKIMHTVAMRMWLYSKRKVSMEMAERVLKDLGLRIVPVNGQNKKKAKK